MEILKSMKNW